MHPTSDGLGAVSYAPLICGWRMSAYRSKGLANTGKAIVDRLHYLGAEWRSWMSASLQREASELLAAPASWEAVGTVRT